MNTLERLREAWLPAFREMSASEGFRRLIAGDATKAQYAALLRQIFHHARENPQIQAFATAYFRGEQRAMVKAFLKHATSEIGHDELAKNDVIALGGDVAGIAVERPLPATTALIGFAYFQIQFGNPIGYLGYLFHLEFMPTTDGARYLAGLDLMGIPQSARSFLLDHAHIDVGHNKLMATYLDTLVTTERDFDDVVYAARTTAYLYGQMAAQAFRSVDAPQDFGIAHAEASRTQPPLPRHVASSATRGR